MRWEQGPVTVQLPDACADPRDDPSTVHVRTLLAARERVQPPHCAPGSHPVRLWWERGWGGVRGRPRPTSLLPPVGSRMNRVPCTPTPAQGNRLDFVLVLISIVEVFMADSAAITVFRSARSPGRPFPSLPHSPVPPCSATSTPCSCGPGSIPALVRGRCGRSEGPGRGAGAGGPGGSKPGAGRGPGSNSALARERGGIYKRRREKMEQGMQEEIPRGESGVHASREEGKTELSADIA